MAVVMALVLATEGRGAPVSLVFASRRRRLRGFSTNVVLVDFGRVAFGNLKLIAANECERKDYRAFWRGNCRMGASIIIHRGVWRYARRR